MWLSVLVILALTSSICHADTTIGKVLSVTDGDTIKLASGEQTISVRLFNIDAPELKQPFGDKAKSLLNILCAKQTVHVSFCGCDGFKHQLANIILPPTRSLNYEMVAQGLAWTINPAENPNLSKAQLNAYAARKGLWSDGQPVPPWDWRLGRFPSGYIRRDIPPTTKPKPQPDYFPSSPFPPIITDPSLSLSDYPPEFDFTDNSSYEINCLIYIEYQFFFDIYFETTY